MAQPAGRVCRRTAAFADHDLAQAQIVTAQLEQSDAQVARVEEQLSRVEMVAPFDGVVASGDCRQNLGAPVERGKVLFEVAPLEDFRMVLHVDERDIAYVALGQHGKLAVAFPNERIGFKVTKITPSTPPRKELLPRRGQARPRDPRLRPGMEGVGKSRGSSAG